jgi:hypothetical protein
LLVRSHKGILDNTFASDFDLEQGDETKRPVVLPSGISGVSNKRRAKKIDLFPIRTKQRKETSICSCC